MHPVSKQKKRFWRVQDLCVWGTTELALWAAGTVRNCAEEALRAVSLGTGGHLMREQWTTAESEATTNTILPKIITYRTFFVFRIG